MDTMNWMRDNLPYIGKKKLWEISIPGTHDSGFFNESGLHWVIADPTYRKNHHLNFIGDTPKSPLWFRCQEISLYDQLNSGIRSLDLRVAMDRTTGKFVFFHGGITASGQELATGLQDLLRFVNETSREIVLVEIKTDDADVTEQENRAIRAMVLNVLQDKLILRPAEIDYADPLSTPQLQSDAFNIENLTARGSRIWMLSRHCHDQSLPHDPYFWNGTDNYTDGTWRGYQSNWENTPCEKIAFMERDLPGLLKTRSRAAIFKNVNLVIWTINLYDAALTYIHPKMKNWLDTWSADAAMFPNLNIISIDWFNKVDWFMDKIMEFNKRPRGPIIQSLLSALQSAAPRRTVGPAGNYAGLTGKEGSAAPFFDIARMRKMIGDLGLDWHACMAEYEKAGNQLSAKLLGDLQAKGIAKNQAAEFMGWYEQQGKK